MMVVPTCTSPFMRRAPGASHLLPQGEKGDDCERSVLFPSFLVGEGARWVDGGVYP